MGGRCQPLGGVIGVVGPAGSFVALERQRLCGGSIGCVAVLLKGFNISRRVGGRPFIDRPVDPSKSVKIFIVPVHAVVRAAVGDFGASSAAVNRQVR